ncbi:protein FAR1-RELATED SEQUENCE 11 [Dendrobium catenatum]|uniref:Protein FAR1-RELATED SEQUENCE n=1 Tax=Dendrobium catenatum TaxID=906689 RepID=A0A2I0VQ68_9ASPA|nr:protein FAR1-RELATED SEQUENCE 11 [Dendrobium catenatum]XP_020703806.1 protein FAR1-RELATED SEQUENCE 11 [Dendrobium catenatum]XP_028556232.1 protein FAR1-RELATED SEQUENCE 11 [Dendrobium catenatum]XP_028556233.1 protein FAR1-RELATED SEQUENCE 11 [Dendrobium catenatum]XP_028556234.1 protein FAR1-RELATED SEQUENCE 11 [Dendrobium catenatum]XP_028556235.1 protein FAR1-RELATED SEQUENCE 11 [Dendrobium catenatum]PKU65558.1 Protein FAR1-RELATED SEQUENCE 11 [Dendrobium catenatum]
MIKISSNGLVQRRSCPCGDDQCYIITEGEEGHSVFESMGSGDPNYLVGGSQICSEVATNILPPYVGQSFHSDEEALEYYSNFARNNGFSVRRERSKGNPEHPMGVYKRELVCHRAGPPLPRKTDDVKRQRNRKASRCKCEAQMVIKKNISGGVTRWVVFNFNNDHNHELMDSSEVRYPPHRNILAVDRDQILALAKSGCTEPLILRALEMERGPSAGQLAYGERDVKTFLQASKSINRESDGSELLKTCRAMKEKNPDFRYDFLSDENNKLEHIAWSYAGSIRAFKLFGDVVVFDTTFHLKAYDRPVGVWFGVDNYGHTIFFCCVILLDERPESLAWSLQAFIRLMDGKFPRTVLTDLNMKLKDAILTNFPNVKNAFCIWHVISKLPSWFSALLGAEFDRFRIEFQRICDLETMEDFEDQWANMIMDFGLGEDKHVSLLYSNRFYWALPYLQGWFFGGLLTVGHSLSIQSFFKGFLHSQTRLKDFIEQVGVAVDFQNQAGEEATTRESQHSVNLKTCMPIEEHASTILTRYAFDMFQKEIMASAQYAVYETAPENYLVRHHLKSDGGHFVSCVPSDEDLHCSCKGFETNGILCRHALRVLSLKNCFFIPDKYLLIRWRRESSLFPKSSSNKYRSQALRSLASIIIQESALTKDRFDYVEWHLSRLLSHVRDMPALDVAASDVEQSSCFQDVVDIATAPSISRGRPRKVKQFVKPGKQSSS